MDVIVEMGRCIHGVVVFNRCMVMPPPVMENNRKIPLYVWNETSVTSNYVILIKPRGTKLLDFSQHLKLKY